MRYSSPIIHFCMPMLSAWLVGNSSAEPPRKPNYSQFRPLVQRSPFTIRPASTGVVSSSPLATDWMLGSIRPSGEDWRVTLINKKDRKQRIRLIPGFAADGFELLDVEQDFRDAEKSKVRVRRGSQEAWIGYDEKLIKVKAPVAKKASPAKPVTPIKRIAVPAPGRSSVSRSRRVELPKK